MGRCLRALGFRSWSAGFETGDIALQPGDALVCLRPRTIGQLFQASAQRGDLPLRPRYQSLCGVRWFCHRLVGFRHGLGGAALEAVYAHSTRRAMPPKGLRLNPPNEPISLDAVKVLAKHGDGPCDEKGRFIKRPVVARASSVQTQERAFLLSLTARALLI
jgi:hypothetical protein